MTRSKAKTFDEWVEYYEQKTGDKYKCPNGYRVYYLPDRGFAQIARSGEMLLIYRRERWALPKGHIDAGEDALSAAIREIAEETGVVGLNFVAPIGNTLHAYNVYGKWELKLTHWFAFSCHSSSTTPQTDEDIVLAVWADREKRIECMTNSYPTIREIVYEYEHRR